MGILDRDLDIFFSVKSIIIFVLAVVFVWWRQNSKKQRLPPGPTGLPYFGYLFFMGRFVPETLVELAKKYGAMFSLPLVGKRYIVLNSYNLVNEALVKNGSVFSGREKPALRSKFLPHEGIVFADYNQKLKSSRKFGLSTLREFGVGKRTMEDRVTEEVRYLSDVILSSHGEPIDIHDDISSAVANIICSILTGQRFEYDDKRFNKLISCLNKRFSDKDNSDKIELMKWFPFLRHFAGYKDAYNALIGQIVTTNNIFENIINDHDSSLDEGNIRDFIDAYLKQIRADRDGHFTRTRLEVYIRDLFAAGTETITTTLRWCMLYLAKYPGFQERLAAEINAAVGSEGVISTSSRKKMALTESFIQEIHRYCSIAPLTIHKVTEDISFHGYSFPKDTCVLVNLWAVHHDPNTFESPEQFRPERFINGVGEFVKHDNVIPYSVGPRYCLGFHLAEMEGFKFLTGIVRNFKIAEDSDHPLPPFDRGVCGLIHSPLPYKISLIPR